MMEPGKEAPPEAPAPGGPPEGGDDPLKDVGMGIMAIISGMEGASPEVAKAAEGLKAAYEGLLQTLSGQGPSQPQAAPGAQMSGGNPNAMPVR